MSGKPFLETGLDVLRRHEAVLEERRSAQKTQDIGPQPAEAGPLVQRAQPPPRTKVRPGAVISTIRGRVRVRVVYRTARGFTGTMVPDLRGEAIDGDLRVGELIETPWGFVEIVDPDRHPRPGGGAGGTG